MPTLAKKAARPVYWIGTVNKCDLCQRPFGLHPGAKIVDGRVAGGTAWGLMDLRCHRAYGVGVGVGEGQVYECQSDGRWLKIEG